MRGEYEPVDEKRPGRRRQEFVVQHANWPKIQSTGQSFLSIDCYNCQFSFSGILVDIKLSGFEPS